MPRYRCTITFPAESDEKARKVLPEAVFELLPRGSSFRLANLGRRKNLRLALILASIALAWCVFGLGTWKALQ